MPKECAHNDMVMIDHEKVGLIFVCVDCLGTSHKSDLTRDELEALVDYIKFKRKEDKKEKSNGKNI